LLILEHSGGQYQSQELRSELALIRVLREENKRLLASRAVAPISRGSSPMPRDTGVNALTSKSRMENKDSSTSNIPAEVCEMD
jgi:hypothetical protein